MIASSSDGSAGIASAAAVGASHLQHHSHRDGSLPAAASPASPFIAAAPTLPPPGLMPLSSAQEILRVRSLSVASAASSSASAGPPGLVAPHVASASSGAAGLGFLPSSGSPSLELAAADLTQLSASPGSSRLLALLGQDGSGLAGAGVSHVSAAALQVLSARSASPFAAIPATSSGSAFPVTARAASFDGSLTAPPASPALVGSGLASRAQSTGAGAGAAYPLASFAVASPVDPALVAAATAALQQQQQLLLQALSGHVSPAQAQTHAQAQAQAQAAVAASMAALAAGNVAAASAAASASSLDASALLHGRNSSHGAFVSDVAGSSSLAAAAASVAAQAALDRSVGPADSSEADASDAEIDAMFA